VEYLGDAFDVDVIEKPRDIEEDDGGDEVAFDGGLCVVNQAEGGVRGAMVVAGSKLGVGEDVEGVGVREDASGDDFLEKLPTTLQEADGAVCFWKAVIGFVRFRDDHYKHVFPGVEPKGDGGVEDRDKPIGPSLEGPFKEGVTDTRGAQSRLVRGWRDGSHNLFLSDRCEVACG